MKRMLRDSVQVKHLQKAIAILTVIDDIFDCKPVFKKIHNEQAKIEMQMDKWMLKFYLRLHENTTLDALAATEEGGSFTQERQVEALRLYHRLIGMLN